MKTGLFLALPLLLAACVTADDPVAAAPEQSGCGAAGFQGLIGQPKAALSSLTLPAGTRIIGPEQAVTMDFRPDRLNVEIGPDARIARIGCY